MTTSISSDALNYKVIITFKYKIIKSEQNKKKQTEIMSFRVWMPSV